MTLDANTRCAACSLVVRDLHHAAEKVSKRLLAYDPDNDKWEQALAADALDLLRAVNTFTPTIDAHWANHDHAYSPELADARGFLPDIVPPGEGSDR